ncbi:MAG: hypothetical protein KGO96_06840 [Elusimicrobia bacterium]|nr:hypothetical protein [Elusimicrobiota bacterium]
MSEFSVKVVQINDFSRVLNSDSLSIISIFGCPCIFRSTDFKRGDKAIYIPIDSVIPEGIPQLKFLPYKNGFHRVKAVRLRGVFSMGLLVKSPEEFEIGQDVTNILGIKKYEEPENVKTSGLQESVPFYCPKYNVESYRKYKDLLIEDEEVWIAEKVHGCNFRAIYTNNRMYIGSHGTWKKESNENVYWMAAKQKGLFNKLVNYPDMVFYGEVFGPVQDLKYGKTKDNLGLMFFDIFDIPNGKFLDYNELESIIANLSLELVPTLFKGPLKKQLLEPLSEGKSTLANHIREGLVVRPTRERINLETSQRIIFKLVSESYLLRKNGTEYQ